jgi:hypothetical protein
MATVRMATTAALGVVTETATAITDVVKSASTGARMLNAFVEDQARRQQIDIKLGFVGYEDRKIAEKQIEIAQQHKAIAQYAQENPEQVELLNKIREQLVAALA